MYNRRSTVAGKSERTVTGSVEEINDPNTKHSINDHPDTVKIREKSHIKIEITKVEKKPPNIANPRIGIMLLKNMLRWIE
jgi:hypothetical protein